MRSEDIDARIEQARGDPVALKRLADELLRDGTPEARAGAIKAINIRSQFLKRHGETEQPSQVPREISPKIGWLSKLDLPHPDGRPLYRYKLSSAVFAQLQDELAGRAAAMRNRSSTSDAALFVLWAAEWFRRCYRGGIQRWEDVGRPIGLTFDYWQGWRTLADTGLKFWRIPELRINGTHHRLAAIARQGGFPVAALEGGPSGWAARYLKQLVGHLLAESSPTLDSADRHAERLIGSAPELWRSEEMRVVSAELALEVVRLRREAEAAGAISGSLISAWLDQFQPAWRDELPLPVDGEAARVLLDDLLRVVPLKGGSGSIGVRRLLRLMDGKRVEIAALNLDGAIESPIAQSAFKLLADRWSRLRLYPSGLLGQYMVGELAMAEPTDDGRWSARSSVARTEFEVPFSVPIQIELRGEGRRACDPFLMPGGERVTDGMRVFVANSEADSIDELIFSGTGSGSYRAEPLYVGVPPGWSTEPHGEGSSCAIFHHSEDGRAIWTINGSARVISSTGDVYLVRAGQKGDKRDILALVGATPRGCAPEKSDIPLYLGVPRLELSDGGRPRNPAPGEVWWRPKGQSSWLSLGAARPQGHIEFAWRDAATGHMRDRKDAIVLPDEFEILRSVASHGTSLTVAGWPGEVEFEQGDRTGPVTCRFSRASKLHSARIHLHSASGDVLTIVTPLPHSASIDHWADGPVSPNSTISLSNISRFVARSEGRCELLADLIDRQRRPVGQRRASWWVDGELPLSAIRDDLAALLRPVGDIDAGVKLNFNDSNEDYWFVSEFELELAAETRGLVPSKAVPEGNTILAGRSLARPAKEREFGSYGLVDNLNHRPIELPKLAGDWLVYLRQEDRVVSRPFFLTGEGEEIASSSALQRAMSETDPFVRDRALDAVCDKISAEPGASSSRAIVKEIADLAISLRGLPPATFDIFLKFESFPLLGPLLLFQTIPTEIATVLRLSEGLPFCWEVIPKRHWDLAAQVEFEALNRAMPSALQLCAGAISGRRKEIAALEASLAPVLDLQVSNLSLREAAQSFLNRSGDRVPDHATSPFRPDFDCLPDWKVSEHFYRDLDAPVVAALAANEAVHPNAEHLYCIKEVARRDPRYFREAFAAAFKEYFVG